jgi:type II restriction enzyme
MAKREDLRRTRKGTVINLSSKKMESALGSAVLKTINAIESNFDVELVHETKIHLRDIVSHLRAAYPDVTFNHHFNTSFLLPDGGILYAVSRTGEKHVVLISEAKRQGTNDLRAKEGLKKQAKGNAIERLGKNVTGFRLWMSTEGIFPFVVFGQGVDFADDSSILDRVSTIAMFAPLDTIEVVNVGDETQFNRGSFFFRSDDWSVDEMSEVMTEVVQRSLYYYFAKYGESFFINK